MSEEGRKEGRKEGSYGLMKQMHCCQTKKMSSELLSHYVLTLLFNYRRPRILYTGRP